MSIVCVANCIWPEFSRDSSGPSCFCVENRGARCFLQVSNAFFSHSILEMCIHSTECDFLTLSCYVSEPKVVGETSVVGMIMLDMYIVVLGEFFERSLGFQCFN